MSEIIGHNRNVLFFGGLPIRFVRQIYHVYVLETSNGTVTVNHSEGPSGTLVTISTVPDAGYELHTISLTGAELINGNQFYINDSDVYVNVAFRIDTNPLNLPPRTIRVKYKDGYDYEPSHWDGDNYITVDTSLISIKTVSESPKILDITYATDDWTYFFWHNLGLEEIIGANSTGVTNMSYAFNMCTGLLNVNLFDMSSVIYASNMFRACNKLKTIPLFDTSNAVDLQSFLAACTSLVSVPLFDTSKATNLYAFLNSYYGTSVPLFDTSNATNMRSMLGNCHNLTSIPLFNTSKVTNMENFAWNAYKVQTGALALYQQASSKAIPVSATYGAFRNCGRDTTNGAAELAQIPSDWK
jgi:surface protein